MNILWADDVRTPELNAAIGRFVAERIEGEVAGFGPFTSMGVFQGGSMIAGMIYHNWSQDRGVIELSGAASSKRWLTKPVLKSMYEYPFEQLGCQMVVQRNTERDTALARMLTAYGFEGHRIPRMRGRDEAEIIFTLTDDAWRSNGFHEVKHGR